MPTAIPNNVPPSSSTTMPRGVNKWKKIAPVITPSAISAPKPVSKALPINRPANNKSAATNSAEPIT